jgi:hypothetical protein
MTEPKEKYFLSFNKEEIFKNLLAIEGHFRNIAESSHSDQGFLSCIVKHLADAEGHADEAISHSLTVEGEEQSRKWAALRDQLREFRRKLQAQPISMEEGIKQTRQIRRFFEGFNREYDISQCKACGNVEEILAKLKIPKTSIAELEEETAHRIIAHLSSKYNVPKPKLKLLDNCPTEPTEFGMFQARSGEPEIVLCRGSADAHKIGHEFAHYLQFLEKKPLSEQEAEQFALKEVAKPIYAEASHFSSGENRMPLTWVDTGFIVGGQHIGKALTKAFEMIDGYVGKAASPVQERPSTWINIGGGLALIVIPRISKRISPTLDYLMTVIGGYMTTKVWDYAEESMAVAPAARFVAAPAPTPPTPTLPTPIAPAAMGIKYQVTA